MPAAGFHDPRKRRRLRFGGCAAEQQQGPDQQHAQASHDSPLGFLHRPLVALTQEVNRSWGERNGAEREVAVVGRGGREHPDCTGTR